MYTDFVILIVGFCVWSVGMAMSGECRRRAGRWSILVGVVTALFIVLEILV